jgi:hypothetical protein
MLLGRQTDLGHERGRRCRVHAMGTANAEGNATASVRMMVGHSAQTTTRLDLREPSRGVAKARLATLEAPPHLVNAAIATWRGRMINEHGSARVFDALAVQMEHAGFSASKVAEVRGFANEERNHGVMCGAVVEALGGVADAPALPYEPFPLHEDATSPVEAVLRNAASIGCLSETVAVALIGAERIDMPEGPLHALLTDIWSDEVGHARFAWRLLGEEVPKLSEAAKRSLSAYLAVAFANVEEHELAHLPLEALSQPGGDALGLCNGSDARALFYSTILRVIVPGLNALGLDASNAWATRYSA